MPWHSRLGCYTCFAGRSHKWLDERTKAPIVQLSPIKTPYLLFFSSNFPQKCHPSASLFLSFSRLPSRSQLPQRRSASASRRCCGRRISRTPAPTSAWWSKARNKRGRQQCPPNPSTETRLPTGKSAQRQQRNRTTSKR